MCEHKTEAVNLNRDEYDVRIDRRTKWGNPHFMRNESQRAQVVEDYRATLWKQIKQGDVTLEELAELKGKRLGCHCAPRSCHGDVLAAAAEWAHSRLNPQSA